MFQIVKILAVGSYKRFAWIKIPNGRTFCVRISDEFYTDLKFLGVPTCQSLRYEKRD